MVLYGSMEAISRRLAGMFFSAMQQHGGKRLVDRYVADWIEGSDAGWSAGTLGSAMSDSLSLIAESAAIEGKMAADKNWW